MKTVTFLNQKGGCGKTSTTYHAGGWYGSTGLRTLLIDNDPQASLTQGFFGPAYTERVRPERSTAALYSEEGGDPDALILETGVPGVWLVPGSRAAREANMRPLREWGQAQWGLGRLAREVDDRFDLCLIDCPPNLHLCSWAAMLAADALVVPLQPEDFGSQGLKPVQESFEEAAAANGRLRMAGYLLTLVDRRLAVHHAYEEMLRGLYGARVFGGSVPRAKDFVEAVAARSPVTVYRPKSAAAKAVRLVAGELLERVGVGAGEVAA